MRKNTALLIAILALYVAATALFTISAALVSASGALSVLGLACGLGVIILGLWWADNPFGNAE